MPNCGCSKACNCSVVSNGAPIIIESGDQLSLVLIETGRVGWQDSVVEGAGRTTDPYSVSWKDSLEYRPRAQEWRQLPFTTEQWTSEPTLYSTPIPNALFLWSPGFPSDVNVTHSGFLVGGYADINTGGVTSPIELAIFFNFYTVDPGPVRIAHSTTSVSNPVLACTGFINPARTAVDLSSSGLVATLNLQIRDPANVVVGINEARIWGVAV